MTEIKRFLKLKATNAQTRKTNKQKLIDTDTSMVVTRGKESVGSVKGKRGHTCGNRRFDLGGGRVMQYTDDDIL